MDSMSSTRLFDLNRGVFVVPQGAWIVGVYKGALEWFLST